MAKNRIMKISPDEDILEALADVLKSYPKVAGKLVNDYSSQWKNDVLTRLRTYPGSVKYPIRWKSEKQRRAFFASDGFGAGIPTGRSGRLREGWKVSIDRSRAAEFSVYNTESYARFVMGDDQQPFHMDTGWMYAQEYIVEKREELSNKLIEIYVDTLDKEIGKNF